MAEEEKDQSVVDTEGAPQEEATEAAPAEAEAIDGEEGDDDEIPMDLKVEDAGPCRKKIAIEINADHVETEIDKGLDELRSTVAIAGFRKGRIPRSLLVKRFGQRVTEEVRANLISSAMKQAIEKEKLDVFSSPDFDDEALEKIVIEVGKPLAFDFAVDVKPKLDLGEYEGIEVKRPKVEVSPKEIDDEIERLRMRRAKVVPIEGGIVTYRDSVVANRDYLLDEEKIHGEENAFIPIPAEDSPLHEKMPWVKEFIGKKAGDFVERDFVFPDDFRVESARGKTGKIKAVIQDIKRLELPEFDEEFLSELGVPDLEGLKKMVGERITAMKDAMADRKLEEELVGKILEKTPVELPLSVIDNAVEGYAARYAERMKEQDLTDDKVEENLVSVRARKREEVEKEFRSFFLLDEIAKREKIFVTEDEVDRRVEAIAANYGKWPSQMREDLEEQGMLTELRNQIREEKVREFLRSKAKVTEGPPVEAGAHEHSAECDHDHSGPCDHDHD